MTIEGDSLQLADLRIAVVRKNIKNIHLGVYPPNGRVRVAAPLRVSDDELKLLLVSKLPWIKKQRSKFSDQERETPREFVTGESHYLNGNRYILEVIHSDQHRKVELKGIRNIVLIVPEGSSLTVREKTMDAFYRMELESIINKVLNKWERKLGVKACEVRIKKMKTKWGSANPRAKRIWLNLELAKKSPISLEYVIAHELTHLLEKNHSERFKKIMDKAMPNWRVYKKNLNSAMLSETRWPRKK